jgi:hypothetical protein
MLYIEQVIYRYLDCGNLHNGFARSKKRRLQAVIPTSIPYQELWLCRCNKYYPFYLVLPVIHKLSASTKMQDFK